MVTHACVARLLSATQAWFAFGPQDVWTLFHSYAFDFAVWEAWGALLHGGRLVVVPELVRGTPELFHELLQRNGVTVLNQTPSAFAQLMRVDSQSERPLDLRLVIFGGEALNVAELRPWLERHGEEQPRLVNMYGITETTVHVTYRPVRMADVDGATGASPIGRPIPDLQIYILDAGLEPVPAGIAGELYVGGDGLARGYLGRAGLTAERFAPNPFADGDRVYRTGDLVRYLEHGDLEFLGRADHQVKIRGYRIELGEIEAALLSHDAVEQAVVLAREDSPGDKRLVAYVVGPDGATPEVSTLRAHLKLSLPDYMVPAAFVGIDRVPLTPNGKLDRQALPAPEGRPEVGEYVAPRTPTEEMLVAIWSEVLKVERIGINDNFFELGGQSLNAIQIAARIQQALKIKIAVRAIFESKSIASLGTRLDEISWMSQSDISIASDALGQDQYEEVL
jgi:acyl-coenzyme A synthetase/AMP-(fatty) acid ligase/acyl carrier protein